MTNPNDKPMILKGRAWVVPVSDVDTDMIFHNRHLHVTDRAAMGQFIFGNLKGWEEFPKKARLGDIVIVGHNFGCGSSRQQAVDGFMGLGIAALIGRSFGAIYKRNAINAALPLIEFPGILNAGISNGDEITLNLESGAIARRDGTAIADGVGMSAVAKDIYLAGGLLSLAKG